MCQFFSCLVTRDGDVRFCEDDSHETIISRLGWPDDRPLETRGWVRAECEPPHTSVCVDETSVPGWYADDRARYDGLVMETAGRVAPARRAYDEAIATAFRAYNEAIAPAFRAYDEATAPARRAYNEAIATASRAYDEAILTARRAYDDAPATITGYVPTREAQ